MRIAILLFCGAFAFGQDASSAPGTPSQPPANSVPEQVVVANDTRGVFYMELDILSDTYRIDFGPYFEGMLNEVRKNWFSFIPASDQMKKGKVAIQFNIAKDGEVADMRIVAPSRDNLDRYAWGSITASNPFPSLPKEFPGPYLGLRVIYYYNPDKRDLDSLAKNILLTPADINEGTPISSAPSKSGVGVTISSLGDSTIPSGESRVIMVTVTGTKKKGVKWSISGLDCANSSCGEIGTGTVALYIAPSAPPNPSEVTLTAVSKADPTAKASITFHIVQPAAQTSSEP